MTWRNHSTRAARSTYSSAVPTKRSGDRTTPEEQRRGAIGVPPRRMKTSTDCEDDDDGEREEQEPSAVDEARASCQARGRAARTGISSTTSTGTARPRAASQRRPGMTKARTRNGTGAKTSQPSSQAATRRRRGGTESSTSVDAQTNAALTSAPESVGARMSPHSRDTFANRTATAAGATPSARQAQNRCP
jgi:hypothetical protein